MGTVDNVAIAYASVRYSDIENIHVTGTVVSAPIDPAIHEMRVLAQPHTSEPVSDNGSNHSPHASIHSPTTLLSEVSPDAEKLKGSHKKSISSFIFHEMRKSISISQNYHYNYSFL